MQLDVLRLAVSAVARKIRRAGDGGMWITPRERSAQRVRFALLVHDEDALRLRGQRSVRKAGGEVLIDERKTDAVWRAERFFEPLRGRETSGGDDEIFLIFRGRGVLREAMVESVAAEMLPALRLEARAQPHRRRVRKIHGRCAEHAEGAARDTGRGGRQVCESPQQREIGSGSANIIKMRAVRRHGDGRHARRLLRETAERAVVRADDGRHRCADECNKRKGSSARAERLHSAGDFRDELVVAAENRVHVAQSGAHDDAAWPIVACARLIEAADISRAAAGVHDDDEPAEREEDRGRSRVIRSEGRQEETQTFHETPPSFSRSASVRRSSAS